MKPNELRIGNIFKAGYVTAVVGEITASGITFDALDGSICVGLCDYSVAKPVELTEEWLIKFGAHRTPNRTLMLWIDSSSIGEFNIIQSVSNKGTFALRSDNDVLGVYPKYVHELQNLFFVLSGKELSLNQTQ